MSSPTVQSPSDIFELEEESFLELGFRDQHGADLGSFALDPDQTVAEVIEEVVGDSGLPTEQKRYEAYHRGRKIPSDATVAEAGVRPGESVELFPTVSTGAATTGAVS